MAVLEWVSNNGFAAFLLGAGVLLLVGVSLSGLAEIVRAARDRQ